MLAVRHLQPGAVTDSRLMLCTAAYVCVTHKRACWDTIPLALRVKQPSAAARVTPLTSSQINLPHTLAFPSAPAGPRLCPLTENGTTSLPPARVASMYKPIELWCGAPPRIWTTMGCSNFQSGLTTLMWFHRGPRCFQLLPRSHSRQRLPRKILSVLSCSLCEDSMLRGSVQTNKAWCTGNRMRDPHFYAFYPAGCSLRFNSLEKREV